MKKPPSSEEIHDDPFAALVRVASDLRDPDGGCPWDREQNHQSVLENLIEEAYETVHAAEDLDESSPQSYDEFKEELGDLLFQVVFHAQMAAEKDRFDLYDVAQMVTQKLIRRHPHVYGQSDAADRDEALQNWEAIKREEKLQKKKETSLLSGIPRHLPALLKAYRMGRKASRYHFDWSKTANPETGTPALFDKIKEEFDELMAELPENPADFQNPPEGSENAALKDRATEELGDLLFMSAQLARHFEIDPEAALQNANRKFQTRFAAMEENFKARLDSGDYPLIEEWEEAWGKVKLGERKS